MFVNIIIKSAVCLHYFVYLFFSATTATTSATNTTAAVGGSAAAAINAGGTFEQMRAGISNISNLFPEINGSISREVEDEANLYFQRIYNHPPHPTLTIDEVLELLKKFQDSSVQRERDVFNCMIKSLFEEYKYFPQYPEKELHITAQLFGGIIGKIYLILPKLS